MLVCSLIHIHFFFIQCTEYYENTIENNHISYLYQGQFHHFFTEKNGTSYLLKDKKENQSIKVLRILNIWKPPFERYSFDLCAIIEGCEICVSFIVKTWNLGIVSSNLTLCYITIYGQLPVSIWFNVLRSENAILYKQQKHLKYLKKQRFGNANFNNNYISFYTSLKRGLKDRFDAMWAKMWG